MDLKKIWTKARSKTTAWISSHKASGSGDFEPVLDDQGLISQQADAGANSRSSGDAVENKVKIKAIAPAGKSESLERLQAGFEKLIDQLKGINEHLNKQVAQHEELMGRIDKLPELLESFPASAENQKKLTEQLIEQLKSTAAKSEQFTDAVERIPTEVARQSDSLADINHQLAAAADADVQMAESFNRFNQSLDRLEQTSSSQSDSIKQMSRTFAAGDRYLKYILSKQRRTFVWVFVIAMGVCTAAILILAGIILYLRR